MERDIVVSGLCALYIIFQLTRSRGAWRTMCYNIITVKDFNSHAHVERDLLICTMRRSRMTFQLTRSRGAWLYDCVLSYKATSISTHTLTWSVTQFPISPLIYRQFQLTRSRGAWLVCSKIHSNGYHFNSHAHVERDCVRIYVIL